MDKVRAKFVCSKVQDQPDFQSQNVALTAVICGSEENKSFSKYTPAGNLNITISDNTQAFGFFAEGVEYYLDFTVAAIPVD